MCVGNMMHLDSSPTCPTLPCPSYPALPLVPPPQSIDALRTQAVAALAKAVPRAILCSGTPALSRPIELDAQVSSRELL